MARARPRLAVKVFLVSLAIYPLGVICHEVIGHGLVGLLFGGRINRVEILGFDVYPSVQWHGWMHRYGECDVVDVKSPSGEHWVSLGGALSTWLVSIVAMVVIWLGRRQSAILAALSLWWIDMFTYTLPSWGLRRSIFWGQRTFSEPYEGAVSLGMPGWLFQVLVVTTSAMLLAAWVHLMFFGARRTRP
jgi:hypothetical protein